jgi:hypothetical protein
MCGGIDALFAGGTRQSRFPSFRLSFIKVLMFDAQVSMEEVIVFRSATQISTLCLVMGLYQKFFSHNLLCGISIFSTTYFI